jgi:hypothetical protein
MALKPHFFRVRTFAECDFGALFQQSRDAAIIARTNQWGKAIKTAPGSDLLGTRTLWQSSTP